MKQHCSFIPFVILILASIACSLGTVGVDWETTPSDATPDIPVTQVTSEAPTTLISTTTLTPSSALASVQAPTTLPLPTMTSVPAQPSVPIVYYYFVAVESGTFPAGSVTILPDVLILAPTLSDMARSTDVVANIGSALQAMIHDPRNAWTSSNLGITSITFSEGNADVLLQGEISGTGDVVLVAARMQIIMTVFAEASVQTATITLNTESIGNLGISHGSEAKPTDYRYTRDEIEIFMVENAYNNY
jgi:hypothetical protein